MSDGSKLREWASLLVTVFKVQRERHRWRKQMLLAVDTAAREGLFAGSSRPDGLRAIRKFEEVNGCDFDPFDDYHLTLVANMGWNFALRRRLDELERQRLAA